MTSATCSLRIGDVVVLRAEGGAPEAEYALFEEEDVELRASGARALVEIAYRTTVGAARERLLAAGVSTDLAGEAARALRSDLATRYARGPVAWKVAEHLGAPELFEGQTFNGRSRRYLGRWLDLEALSVDVRLLRATTAIQALHLVALLDECEPRLPVVLTTAELAKTLGPGERTFRRCEVSHANALPAALEKLHKNPFPRPTTRETGRSIDHLLDVVRRKMSLSGTPGAQTRLMRVERALMMRDRPEKGALADAELWQLETRLSLGDHANVVADVHAIEQNRGRTLGTSYIRAYAALVGGTIEPRALASHVSTLTGSRDAFPELHLLAARAWAAAGDAPRALAYARDIADHPEAHSDLKSLASDLVGDVMAKRKVRFSEFPVNQIHQANPPQASTPPAASGGSAPPPAYGNSNANARLAAVTQPLAAPPLTGSAGAGARNAHETTTVRTNISTLGERPTTARMVGPLTPRMASEPPVSAVPDTAIEPMPVVSITPPPSVDYLPQVRVELQRVSARDPRSEPPDELAPASSRARTTRRPSAPPLDLSPPAAPVEFAPRRTPYPPRMAAVPPSVAPPPAAKVPASPHASAPPPATAAGRPGVSPAATTLLAPGGIPFPSQSPPQSPSQSPAAGATARRVSRPPPDERTLISNASPSATSSPPPQIPRAPPAPTLASLTADTSEAPIPPPEPTVPSVNASVVQDDELTVAIVRHAPGHHTRPDAGPPRPRLSSRPAFVPERAPPPPGSPDLMGPRQLDTGHSEFVDTLTLPGGLPGDPPPLDFIPGSEGEARVAFTCFSRDLAREFKLRFGVVCKTDMSTVDVLQRSLRERFPSGEVRSREEVLDVRRHGALLSELLVRVLGGYWIDIYSSDLADWAMFVPPSTRIWPFARVMRYVVMGDKETDLVSYYLELEARALRA